jgi:DNA-binding MarR family transcriptional regulator
MGRRPPVTAAEYEAIAGFRYALRLFLHASEEAARRAGITPQQHQALLALKGFPAPCTVSDLAERLQVRHHSAVGLVDRLAALGLVRRAPAADDRRSVHLRLTARGEARLRAVVTATREELRRIEPHLKALLRALAGSPRRGEAPPSATRAASSRAPRSPRWSARARG